MLLEFPQKFKLGLHPEGDRIGNMYYILGLQKKIKIKKEKQAHYGATGPLQKYLIYTTLLLVI